MLPLRSHSIGPLAPGLRGFCVLDRLRTSAVRLRRFFALPLDLELVCHLVLEEVVIVVRGVFGVLITAILVVVYDGRNCFPGLLLLRVLCCVLVGYSDESLEDVDCFSSCAGSRS